MWCPFAVQTFTRNDQFRSHTRFQRKLFLSLIEGNFGEPSLMFTQSQDIAGDRDALIDIYKRFEVPESQYIKQARKFFDTLQDTRSRFDDDEYTLEGIVHLVNGWRIHSLVEEWFSTVEKERQALKPRDAFVDILNRMFHRKQTHVLDNNELLFTTTSEKTLTAFELSSGEKQLYIIFAEALLQRGKSCIYPIVA